jgi:hypothetical protein
MVGAAAFKGILEVKRLQGERALRELAQQRGQHGLDAKQEAVLVNLGRFKMMLDLNRVMGDTRGEQRRLTATQREVKGADLGAKAVCERAAVHGEEVHDRGQLKLLKRITDRRGDTYGAQGEGGDELELSFGRGHEPDATMGTRDGEGARALKACDHGGAKVHATQTLRDGLAPGLHPAMKVREAARVEEEAAFVGGVGLHAWGEVIEGEK